MQDVRRVGEKQWDVSVTVRTAIDAITAVDAFDEACLRRGVDPKEITHYRVDGRQ